MERNVKERTVANTSKFTRLAILPWSERFLQNFRIRLAIRLIENASYLTEVEHHARAPSSHAYAPWQPQYPVGIHRISWSGTVPTQPSLLLFHASSSAPG